MTTELSKNLICIQVRSGVEIWVEKERAEVLVGMLTAPNPPQFLKYEGRIINRADIVGVFTAQDMEECTRRKNGQWKCPFNFWHEKKQECAHHLTQKNYDLYKQDLKATSDRFKNELTDKYK